VLFVLPLVGLLTLLVIYPTTTGIYHSFYDWNPGYGESPFIAFDNYLELARSAIFQEILVNEAIFLFVGVPIFVLLPLLIAVLLYERVPFAGVFRTIYFFPAILSPAIIGMLFRAILRPDGLLNNTLDQLSLGVLSQNWTTDPALVKPTLIVLLAWASVGTGVVIFSAGLSAVPPEMFEAAEMDGASWLQRFRFVMLPSLRPLIEFWFVIQVVSVFLFIFGWIYVLTQGGPGYASTTMDYDVYTNAFSYLRFGLAAAEAVYLLLFVIAAICAAYGLIALSRPVARLWRRTRDSNALRWVDRGSDVYWNFRTRRRVQRARPGRRRRRSWSPARTVIAVLITIPFLYPLVFLISTAVKAESDFLRNPIGFPRSISFAHFSYAWRTAGLQDAMLNSLVAVGIGTLLCVALASMAAFFFRTHVGVVSRTLLFVTVSVWFLPWVVWVIPFFVLVSDAGLTNSLAMLGVTYAIISAPFAVFFLWSYFRNGIPDELLEASAMDGASSWQQFARIAMPLSLPALATVAVLTAVNVWGDLLFAIILLQDPAKLTATAAAAGLTSAFNTPIQAIAAASLITIAPLILIFAFAQRAIMRGFTAGIGK
jgi:ABC-type sugar transport system permease subunit